MKSERPKRCRKCLGSGLVRLTVESVPYVVTVDADCGACGGKGYVE